MSISDGQLANATNYNNAFLSRTVNTSTVGIVGLLNLDAISGATVANLQREINGLHAYLGSSLGGTYDQLPTWASSVVGTATDTVQERADALTAEFDTASGHTHDGVDSPLIDAETLDNVRLKGSFVRGTNLAAVTGSSVVVTTELTGKTASSGDTVKGVVVSEGINNVILKDNTAANRGDQLRDANGDIVFGRLTESAGVWTLSFYVDVAGVQTAHSFTAQAIQWFYQELFSPLTDAPIYSELASVPSDNATQDVIDATSALRGLVSAAAQSFGGVKTFVAGIVGQAYMALQRLDVASAATITALSSAKSFVKLTGSTATDLQGITAGVDGQTLTLHNGSSAALTISHEDAGATAANRVKLPAATDLTIEADETIEFVYDTGQSRWVIKSGSGSGSGSAMAFVTIGLTGSGADYIFSDTADYHTAADSAELGANGGILYFLPGTYTFTTVPTWRPKIRHLGASRNSVTLSLPTGSTTGSTSSSHYFFEDLSFTSAGTTSITWNTSRTVTAKNITTDSGTRWQPRTLGDNYAENCTFGHSSADWSDGNFHLVSCIVGGSSTLDVDSKIRAVNSTFGTLTMTDAGTNSGALNLQGGSVTTLTMGGSSFWTNCRFVGVALPAAISANITGKFEGNTPASANRDYYNEGDQAANFAIDWDTRQSLHLRYRLTDSVTITGITNGCSGKEHILQIVQDGTGSRTITWPGSVTWLSGSAPTLSTAAGAIDVISLFYDGTTYYGAMNGGASGANTTLSNLTSPTALNQQLRHGAGSNTAPSYSFTGATDVGMYYAGTELVLGNASAGRLFVGATGNVGVGAAAPAHPLEVRRDQDAFSFVKSKNATDGAGAAAAFIVDCGASVINGFFAGFSPSYSGVTGWAGACVVSAQTPSTQLILNSQSGSAPFSFEVGGLGSGNEKMRIEPSGEVLIGTSTINQKLTLDGGSIAIVTAGHGLRVKEGSNAKMGIATLVAGAVTVSTTAVTATSRIFLTSQVDGGTPGFVRVSSRTAATSFVITSSNGADTSDIAWIIVDPA